MHPELLSSLAAERRRDLDADIAAHRAPRARAGTRTGRRAHTLTRPALVPRFRVSWTRTTLAAVSGSRRGRSVVIVISATRSSS
jgi:hypothetical protein